MSTKLIPLLISAALAGCAADGYYTTGTVAVTASTPDLAYVSPGVYVIANYDEPIFYSSGFYWYYAPSGYWYRSSRYTGGWVYASPPYALTRIGRPHAYAYYRPHGYVPRNRPVPSQRIDRPWVRDHRARRAPPYRR